MAKLKLPQFWYAPEENKKSPLLAGCLWPLSKLYRLGATLNNTITFAKQSPLPVICVGNLTMGGAGKTPTARAIHKIVQDHGKYATPCFLMRGYGGSISGPEEVDLSIHTLYDVGDEALMQARYAPVIISSNRHAGAKLAKARGYDLIIMDDGFQNPKLKKDLSIIVIDGGFMFGNGYCFPAGPLREPVSVGIKRAQAALIIGADDDTDTSMLDDIWQFDGKVILDCNDPEKDNKKVLAFAGIARPEKFFNTLEQNGYHVHSHFHFPDHHIFRHDELRHLYERAEKAGARLMTTEKDWIRLSDKWREKINYLGITIECEPKFTQFMNNMLDRMQ